MSRDIDPTRSRNMRAIRGRDTGPELLLRRGLHGKGFRYCIAPRTVPGRPDLVLPHWNAVVLVHGCFWHAHSGCRYFRLPKTRGAFWSDKLEGNTARDARTLARLKDEQWRIAVVWECALRADPTGAILDVARFLKSKARYLELAAP